MSQEQWDAVDRYFRDLVVRPDPALDAALEASAAAGLPATQVSAAQGKLLHLLARAKGARAILEIGTLGGYSAIWLARALPVGGRLITLEIAPKNVDVARSNIARAGLADVVTVRVGRALDTLPQLVSERQGPFDLIFIDADEVGYPEYLTWTLRLVRPGGLIVADNVVRGGAIVDAESADASVRAVRRFNEMLAAEPRVSATVVQTVGAKGYDGMAIAFIRAQG